jgi:hypothetical protein
MSFQYLIVDALVRFQSAQCGICGGHGGKKTIFFRVLRGAVVNVILPMFSINYLIHSFEFEGRGF